MPLSEEERKMIVAATSDIDDDNDVCVRCGSRYCCRDGEEATPICDHCAQDIASFVSVSALRLDAELAAMRKELEACKGK